jgi:hypothetical protein
MTWLLSGTAVGVPKKPGETHFLSQKKTKHKQFTNLKHTQNDRSPSGRSPRPWWPQRPTRAVGPATLRRNSASLEGHNTALTKPRLARGLAAPSGEVPPHSRVGHPLWRVSAPFEGWTPPRARSASLEGWPPPRAIQRLARGSHGLAAPVPAPPAGALNALTPAGESTHIVPLTRLGIISRRCSANPPGEAIPANVRHCAVRPGSAP